MTDLLLESVLVANRGEIARRIIRTLRSLGIRSIAIYSDADADAPHVREADIAVRIGPAAASASYLDIDAVMAAVRETGARAVHPGYGFLSENVALARACATAGVVLIGPGERALEVMGDKIRAKEHVAGYGVPTVPGFSAVGMPDARIAETAGRIGYPLLIKPSAGGGGKGMQIVRGEGDLPDALAASRRVAASAFGDDALLLERLIERPRHIEVQVLADGFGSVIHLGERECTLQRRHQKVIEEAPSPIIDDAARRRLGEAACAAAASVDYRGAGTVEFLVAGDRPEEFFFIEMNTRLQVEHPVTELVTGIDLVEQQVRVASGLPLAFAQDAVRMRGHAIEARVYAESPERGFLPATGDVLAWTPPAQARTDAAIESGSLVTADYDPMIAKIIAHGDTRAEALARLDTALADTVLLGVDANIAFLRALLADPAVADGDLDTGLIDRMPPFIAPAPSPAALRAAAEGALALDQSPARERRSAQIRMPEAHALRRSADLRDRAAGPLWSAASGWRAGAPAESRRITVQTDSGALIDVDAAEPPPVVHRSPGATTAADAEGWTWVHVDGATHRLRVLSRRAAMEVRLAARERAATASDPDVRAPMPGAVVALHVEDGAAVSTGDPLVTIEAMKMEHSVTAAHEGVVRLDVALGDQVRRTQIVAHVAAPDHPEENHGP